MACRQAALSRIKTGRWYCMRRLRISCLKGRIKKRLFWVRRRGLLPCYNQNQLILFPFLHFNVKYVAKRHAAGWAFCRHGCADCNRDHELYPELLLKFAAQFVVRKRLFVLPPLKERPFLVYPFCQHVERQPHLLARGCDQRAEPLTNFHFLLARCTRLLARLGLVLLRRRAAYQLS